MNPLRRGTGPLPSLASDSPRTNTARWALQRRMGVNRAANVITFRTNFSSSGFDRPVTDSFKDQILSKLDRAGIANLTVLITRGPRRELVLHFEGPDEEVEKAKAAFARQ